MRPFTQGIIWTIIAISTILAGLAFARALPHSAPEAPLPIAEASGQVLGGTTYSGVTSTTYNGNLGGLHGANTKCQLVYPNSHICTQGEILASGTTNIPGNGWVLCDIAYGTTCFGVTDTVVSVTNVPCSGYTSNIGSDSGIYLDTTGTLNAAACNTNQPIHCCI